MVLKCRRNCPPHSSPRPCLLNCRHHNDPELRDHALLCDGPLELEQCALDDQGYEAAKDRDLYCGGIPEEGDNMYCEDGTYLHQGDDDPLEAPWNGLQVLFSPPPPHHTARFGDLGSPNQPESFAGSVDFCPHQ